MDIKEFIKTHDLITIGGIEKKLGLTKGTLRIDRDIPERYKGSIESILVNYGYECSRGEKEVVVEAEIKDTRKVYKIGKGLVPKDKNGEFWKTTTDFVDGDEVYISKV